MSKITKNTIVILIFCLLLYFNLQKWNVSFLGWVILFAYFLHTSRFVKNILVKFFNFGSSSIRCRIISAFLVCIILSSFAGFFLLVGILVNEIIVLTFFIVGLIIHLINYWAFKSEVDERGIDLIRNIKEKINLQVPRAKIGVFLYITFWFVGLVLLFGSRFDGNVLSPWQVIDGNYIIAFFGATLFLGLLIFSRLTSRFLLFLLIIHAFLMHSYLGATHPLIYGTDQWRHMAVEKQVINTGSTNIVLNDEKPVNVLQALNPGKLAYSQLWATESLIAKITNTDLIKVNKWLVVILFSLLVPVLLYEIGLSLKFGQRKRLLMIWLSFLFFPLVSLGSMTLPVSFGFLSFLLMILLVLKRLMRPRKEQLIIISVLLLLSIFGYSLYVILFALFWASLEIMDERKSGKNKKVQFLKGLGLAITSALIIPAIELTTAYSKCGCKLNVGEQVKQFIGNLLGIYIATGPRTHDILGGNLFFNQIPSYSFVSNVFTDLRMIIPFLVIGILLLSLIGFVACIRTKKTQWISILSAGLLVGYFLGFYLFEGQKLLSRRMDMTLSFLLLLLLTIGLHKLLIDSKKNTVVKIVIAVVIMSFAITLSYSLGPDTKTIKTDQYKSMSYVWHSIKEDKNHCVISDTYSLLALEYHSAKKIVGGGFSVDKDHGQSERMAVYNGIKEGVVPSVAKLKGLTNTDRCFVVMSSDELGKAKMNLAKVSTMRNVFANIEVWEYN